MNRGLIFLTLLSLLAFSCNKDKIADLEKRNQAMMQEMQGQDSLLNSFMASFDEFEMNLESIKQKESLISFETDGAEFKKEGKEKILEDLATIDELMVRNQEVIQDLNERLEKADKNTAYFRRTVARFKQQLADKDAAITELKESLVAMNIEVEGLNEQVATLRRTNTELSELTVAQQTRLGGQETELARQDSIMMAQVSQMNRGYVLTGTSKELKSQKILTKEGGFLGLGGVKKLSADFDPSLFDVVDIQTTSSIPVSTKKAQLITQHPADSYLFTDDSEGKTLESLEIIDPERFWKHSKYLVVVLN